MTHPDGRDVALGVGVIGESQQQTGFADTRVADEEELQSGTSRWREVA